MAGDATGGSGGADRSNSGETGRPDDPWQRIETEKPQRDTARKAWDAQHDPSPEYEYAIRALPEDYGKDRPANRDLTEAQRQELAEVFGRPADELLAVRDKDPRAAHNRDEQGRILDHNGNPREDKTPEQLLREAERQAKLHGPNAEAPDPRAPSDQPAKATTDRTTESEPTRRSISPELHQRIDELTAELRADRLTPAEAADQIDKLRRTPDQSPEPAPAAEPEAKGTVPYDEPSTETVDTKDGLNYERPERRDSPDLLEPEGNRRFSSFLRKWAEGGEDVVDGAKEVSGNMVDGLKPAAVQPSPSWDTPQYAHVQGDSGQPAGTAVVVALLTAAAIHGLKQRKNSRTRSPNEENR